MRLFQTKFHSLLVPLKIEKLFIFEEAVLKQNLNNQLLKMNLHDSINSGKAFFEFIFSIFKKMKVNFLLSFIFYGKSNSEVANEYKFNEINDEPINKFKIKLLSLGKRISNN